MNSPQVIRYELHTLLNYIPEDHFFRQKTKKVYRNFYQSMMPLNFTNSSSGGNSSGSGATRRKSYLPETEVFSDERAIQEIRGALGKISHANKQNIIDTLRKNTVSEKSFDLLVHLLYQYATLCLEWNDLYLLIYDKVYFQSNTIFYPQIYELAKKLIEFHKEYEDPEQKMFFRISNIEIYCKLGLLYPSFRKDTLMNWTKSTINRLYTLFVESKFDIDWLILIIHLATVEYKMLNNKEKKQLKSLILSSDWFKEINKLVDDEKLPIKIRFKWMDFADILDYNPSESSSAE